jgi:hypothetical protein
VRNVREVELNSKGEKTMIQESQILSAEETAHNLHFIEDITRERVMYSMNLEYKRDTYIGEIERALLSLKLRYPESRELINEALNKLNKLQDLITEEFSPIH